MTGYTCIQTSVMDRVSEKDRKHGNYQRGVKAHGKLKGTAVTNLWCTMK